MNGTICTRLAWYWRSAPQSFVTPPLSWESLPYSLGPFLLTWKSLLWRGATPIHSDPWLAVNWPSPPFLCSPFPFPLPPTVPHFKYVPSYDDITTSASHSPIQLCYSRELLLMRAWEWKSLCFLNVDGWMKKVDDDCLIMLTESILITRYGEKHVENIVSSLWEHSDCKSLLN